MHLEGKVGIVTGGSRGIGRAVCLGLARHGADVVVAARTETPVEGMPGTIHDTAKEIEGMGRKALAVKCDVTAQESVEEMVRITLEEFGRIDVLVNNAAVAFYAPTLDMPLKRWELVLRVSLTGAFVCTKAVLPTMIEQKSGSIVNISSGAATARGGTFTGIAYDVAKAGVERFTYGLAAELGKYNIAANCVKPRGIVDTEGMRFWNPNADYSRWDSPDQMVRAVLFLAAQSASGVSAVVATDEELGRWHAAAFAEL
ncbi:MAG: SDR family NAD(P)-dependent oxidoreductase [Chloroflexota bacterium]